MERKTLIWTLSVFILGATASFISWYSMAEKTNNMGPLFALLFLSFILLFYKIWPRSPLFKLTLEPFILIGQLLLQVAWILSLFFFDGSVVSVMFLLLLWSNTLFAVLLYWKREGFSGYIANFPMLLLGTIYFVSLGALTCILRE